MSKSTEDFFDRKKPWSWIKDNILASYLPAYFAKISMKKRPVLFIDAFAGAGKFDDGSPGSPLITIGAARKHLKVPFTAVFVNKDRADHDRLERIVKAMPNSEDLIPIQGDSRDLLQAISPHLLQNTSVFLYMDPFGLKFEFESLYPFLERNRDYSTEILVNLNMGGLHRGAGRNKSKSAPDDPVLLKNQQRLTATLGGDYWRDAIYSEGSDAKERERRVVDGFMERLSSTGYLTYTGACPVLEHRTSQTKYYMVFASRHPDALILMNHHMLDSFEQYLTKQEFEGTLFENMSWKAWRNPIILDELVVEYVRKHPGTTRKKLWAEILKNHFMRYQESEYRIAAQRVLDAGLINSPTPRKTRRLNDDCVLLPINTLI